MMHTLFFVLGVVLLVGGAAWLVKGAKGLALSAGISPLVIGLTVVAIGTSTPELAVSFSSALAGKADIAVGNVVGSNIANILLILGLCAGLGALPVNRQIVTFDGRVMLLASVLVFVFALDGHIGMIDGAICLLGALAYLTYAVVLGKQSAPKVAQQSKRTPKSSLALNVLLVVVGIALLVIGAKWVVEGAVVFAKSMGVSELVVGLTIVAVGTSLPEIATSIMATFHGERDLAVGNVIGSNILNIFVILGASALAAGQNGLPVNTQTLWLEIPIMLASAFILVPIMMGGGKISSKHGLLLLAGYGLYLLYTVVFAMAPAFWPIVMGAAIVYGLWALASLRGNIKKEKVGATQRIADEA